MMWSRRFTAVRRLAQCRFSSTNHHPVTSVYGSVPPKVWQMIEKIPNLANKPRKSDFILIHGDYCPFAHRAWLSALEKEDDPTNPQLFDEVLVCQYLPSDPAQQVMKALNLRTVPSAIYRDQVLNESLEIAQFIDDLHPDKHPLKPADPVMRFNMYRFIAEHNSIPGDMYGYLMGRKSDDGLIQGLTKFNENLGIFTDGPFLCGSQFTLADIHLFGFIERCLIVLPYYKNTSLLTKWEIPHELKNIYKWWEAVIERPSVKVIQTSPRNKLSQSVQVFEDIDREDYLIEVYLMYANNEVDGAKAFFADFGEVGYNSYRRHEEGWDDDI